MNPAKPGKTKKTALSRLYSWMDQLDLKYVSFTNLSADPDWNFNLKTVDKKFLEKQLEGYDKIIALGGLVSNYLAKYLRVDHIKMPHPSYRNRALNDSNYEHEQLLKCRTYIYG
jgi:alcohol dehydrogenase class IV